MSKRMKKITTEQKEVIVQFMEEHPELVGKIKPPFKYSEIFLLWNQLISEIEKCPNGPKGKTVEELKKTWQDMKRSTRYKREKLMGQPGIKNVQNFLNPLEIRILAVVDQNELKPEFSKNSDDETDFEPEDIKIEIVETPIDISINEKSFCTNYDLKIKSESPEQSDTSVKEEPITCQTSSEDLIEVKINKEENVEIETSKENEEREEKNEEKNNKKRQIRLLKRQLELDEEIFKLKMRQSELKQQSIQLEIDYYEKKLSLYKKFYGT